MNLFTQDYLKSILHYDPATGFFTWVGARYPSRNGTRAGTVARCGGIDIRINNEGYKANRLAWLYMTGAWPENLIDHRNNKRADNRFDNLRPATRIQNNWNARLPRTNTSGFKGVSFHPATGKWVARVPDGTSRLYLGLFESPELADAACRSKREAIQGEFANHG